MKYNGHDFKSLKHGDTIQCYDADEMHKLIEELRNEGYSAWPLKEDTDFIIFISGAGKGA